MGAAHLPEGHGSVTAWVAVVLGDGDQPGVVVEARGGWQAGVVWAPQAGRDRIHIPGSQISNKDNQNSEPNTHDTMANGSMATPNQVRRHSGDA